MTRSVLSANCEKVPLVCATIASVQRKLDLSLSLCAHEREEREHDASRPRPTRSPLPNKRLGAILQRCVAVDLQYVPAEQRKHPLQRFPIDLRHHHALVAMALDSKRSEVAFALNEPSRPCHIRDG